MEKSRAGTKKKEIQTVYHILLSKYNNNKHNMVIFNMKWKKYNEILLTKNKMDLNIRKMTNHPPSPASGIQTKEGTCSANSNKKW